MADMEKELDAHSISIKANELLWPLKVIDSHVGNRSGAANSF